MHPDFTRSILFISAETNRNFYYSTIYLVSKGTNIRLIFCPIASDYKPNYYQDGLQKAAEIIFNIKQNSKSVAIHYVIITSKQTAKVHKCEALKEKQIRISPFQTIV